MRTQSPDEVRAEFVRCFPAGTGELGYEIWRSLAHLDLKWKVYRDLYGTSPERIDLLNSAAPAFFGQLDAIMRHDVALAITRLTDPAGSGTRINASLTQFLVVLEPHVDQSALRQWRTQLREVTNAVRPVRAIRNRFLAHEDLATTLSHHPEPLAGFSRADIEDLLSRIRDLFDAIEERYRGLRTSHSVVLDDGAEQLIEALERARAHRTCEHAEFKRKYGVDLGNEVAPQERQARQ